MLLLARPSFLRSYWVGLLTQMVIFAILAMSLDILLGYTGLPSLGHAGVFGVAAYAVAVMSTTYHAGFWACVAGGILGGTVLSACLGLLVSHVRNTYFLMITLALGMVLWGVSYRWIPVTGGDNGISGDSAARGACGPARVRRDPVLLRRAPGVRGVRRPDGARSCARRSASRCAASGKTSRA